MPFISFEGSECCGKSTQVELLAARLRGAGELPLILREPGGTPIGEVIRDLLQHAEINRAMAAETELLLFAASRSQLVREKIEPALRDGSFVISDRFFDSTTVYQGAGRGLDLSLVERLNHFAVGSCHPELTFLLEIDRATGCERLEQRLKVKRDRMEEQPPEFYERVESGYRELARREPHRVVALDGRRTPEALADEIWSVMEKRFPKLHA